MAAFIINLICYFAVPLWMLAGICDWWCHRITAIEKNSGIKESLIHSVMLFEMGIPILAALFLEVNALVLTLALTLWLVHEATALWDVSYAHKRRYLSPFEQHVHSFLELMPLMTFVLLAALHWTQFLALFGAGSDRADFTPQWKRRPLPLTYSIAVLGGVVCFQLIPYGEELWRCWRAKIASENRVESIQNAPTSRRK
ncbi:MAG TPA: hypothetical protein VGK97_12050 [Spongiibacteraceae bacterium]